MKIGIVSKLFMLTTLLCMLILATIFMGQTIFFKQYYAKQKVEDIETNIQSFKNEYIKAGGDLQTIQKLEQDFYQENTTWITTLDSLGNIKYANDFSVKVHLDSSRDKDFSNRVINIPLYSFIGLEDLQRVRFELEQGSRIMIDGLKIDDKLIPAIITVENRNAALDNRQLSEKLYGKRAVPEPIPKDSSQILLKGVIKELQLPGAYGSNIYTNRVFIERVKQFQVNLLLNENQTSEAETLDYEENNINYKLFIRPIKSKTGETTYIFAMASLQPVDEVVQVFEDYYPYLTIFVLLLIVLASFYYLK